MFCTPRNDTEDPFVQSGIVYDKHVCDQPQHDRQTFVVPILELLRRRTQRNRAPYRDGAVETVSARPSEGGRRNRGTFTAT